MPLNNPDVVRYAPYTLCYVSVLAALCVSAYAQQPTSSASTQPLEQKPLYQFSESDLDRYLPALQALQPDVSQRVLHLARKNIGQPYELYLLGEFPFEMHDPDPLYNLAKSDCVTHVEHIFAAALADDFWTYLKYLQRLRYKGGMIGMLTRNHFTEADWNRNNGFLFEDMTAALGGGKLAVPMTATIKRAKFFAKFNIGQDIPDEKFRDTYIPKESVPQIVSELRDADVIEIVRGDRREQYVGHLGIAVWQSAGCVRAAPASSQEAEIANAARTHRVGDDRTGAVLNFLHSGKPAVREEPLLEYVERDPRCVGIKVLRLRENALRRMEDACLSGEFRAQFELKRLTRARSEIYFHATLPLSAIEQLDTPECERQMFLHDQRLQSRRLMPEEPLNPRLQHALEAADRHICGELGIAPEQRAFGVLDLNELQTAMIRPDALFYGAGVPKIVIPLAYFEQDPSRAEELPPETLYELQLMITRSSDEMAAKYSRLIGLDFIQKMLRSEKYRLYDESLGGGLWIGQHYGSNRPGTADPLGGFSHAATVRQCLRYYLMRDQGRLGDRVISEYLKAVFAAEQLQLHQDSFVEGLCGRDVTLIRKNGSSNDWHLDTARVVHGRRAYLIAGAVHHPAGPSYLARMAAEIDRVLCASASLPCDLPERSWKWRTLDEWYPARSAQQNVCRGVDIEDHYSTSEWDLENPWLNCFWFNQAIISWNIDINMTEWAEIEVRVGRTENDYWSPWLYVGHVGNVPVATREPVLVTTPRGLRWETRSALPRQTAFGGGRIETDYFHSTQSFNRFDWRVTAPAKEDKLTPVRFVRVELDDTLTYPQSALWQGDSLLEGCGRPVVALGRPPKGTPFRHLPVPFRSQRAESPDIASRICSPTCVAMVMAYHGVHKSVPHVAAAAYDPVHDIYGNWPRNIQAAYSFGVPGYLTRISDWRVAERYIAEGTPLIASVRWSEEGRLRNSPLKTTAGHLIVITGFTDNGMVHVNDPAAPDAATGQTMYCREDLEQVWLKNAGGVAYVLLPPEKND